MSKGKAPAFQLFAGDMLSDTLTWSAQELGVHVKLMCWSWDNGPVPDDMDRITRIDRDARKVWKMVGTKWTSDGNGGLVNARLERTRQELVAYRERQSQRGKKSAEKRWGDNQSVTSVTTNASITHQPNRNNIEGVGVDTVLQVREERAKAPDGFAEFWSAYPEKKAKAAAEAAWAKLKPEDAAKCKPAIEAQVAAKHFTGKDGNDYVPHGSTWLNQRRWEDEVRAHSNPAPAKPAHTLPPETGWNVEEKRA